MFFINTQGLYWADCFLTSISDVQLATGASQSSIYFNGNCLELNQIERKFALARLSKFRSRHSVFSVLKALQK